MAAAAAKRFGIDVARVEAAVRAAERDTSGEIRVAVSRFFFWGDVRRAAARVFGALGIHRTRHRNGVLIFVAPWRRRFAVLGDVGINTATEKTHPDFWKEVAAAIAADFRRGEPTAGLERAVATIGRELATHFPPDPGENPNELLDTVELPIRPRRDRS